MISVLSLVLFLLTCVLSFKRDVYGISIFMAIRILVPENVRFLNSSISLNTALILNVFLIWALKQLIYKRIKWSKQEFSFLFVLLAFVVYSAITLPLSDYGNLSTQYSYLLQFTITDILPALIAILTIKSEKDIRIILNVYIVATIITCIYGIFSFLINNNPYAIFMVGEINLRNGDWKGASTGSTFYTATGFGYFLTMSLPLLLYLYNKIPQKKVLFSIILVCINIVLCKKRTALICALMLFLIIIMLELKKNKANKLMGAILLGVSSMIVIYFVPQLNVLRTYITSVFFFFNDNATGVATTELGSTWDLRVRQFVYPYTEIKNNYLLGHGYDWSQWYLSEYKLHKALFGFETIFSTAICNFGIMGYCVYGLLFYKSYKYSRLNDNFEGLNYQLLYIITIIVMSVGSGLNYCYFFFIGVVIMHKVSYFLSKFYEPKSEEIKNAT